MAAINLTGFDEGVITVVNPAISVSYFAFLVLPALLLALLCVVALLLSRIIDTNIRVLLINIFATDLTTLLGNLVVFLSHPAEVSKNMEDTSYSCKFAFSAIFVAGVAMLPATCLYAVVVYIYVKYGMKKVKLYMIIPPIIVIWVVAFLFGVISYTNVFNAFSNRGICDSDSIPLISTLSVIIISSTTVIFLSIQVVFGVLTFCYVKRNTLQEQNRDLLKAIVKLLLYLLVESFFVLIPNVTVYASDAVQRNLKSDAATKFDITAYYTRQALYVIPFLLGPIMTIVLLKPVRESLQKICCGKCTDERPSANPVAVVAGPNLENRPLATPEQDVNYVGNLTIAVELRDLEAVTHNALGEMNPEPAHREQNADGTSIRPPADM
jgi:hypothetical protein